MAQSRIPTPRRWSALLAVFVLGFTLVVSQGTGRAQGETCRGTIATIVGTTASELLSGTAGPDVIQGLGGDDTIFGLAGNDRICGGDGVDDISGDEGDDLLYGNGGGDTIDGGTGNDIVEGDADGDTLGGGLGADDVLGGSGADTIEEPADDPGQNVLSGGLGNDTSIDGGEGNDEISGGDGDDQFLVGNGGVDTISGGKGNDGLFGNDGDDSLDGGSDRDKVEGGDGADQMLGGGGPDVLEGGLGPDNVKGGGGKDDLAEPPNDVAANSLYGDSGNDVSIVGGEGDDNILAGSGDDVFVSGNGGSDAIFGGTGRDELLGGDGNDTLVGGADSDRMTGMAGDDSLSGGGGPDLMFGEDGVDDCVGGAGGDSCNGGLPGTDTPSPSDPDTCGEDVEKIKNCRRASESISGTLFYTWTYLGPTNDDSSINATINIKTKDGEFGCCVDDGTTFSIQYSRHYARSIDGCSYSGSWSGIGEGFVGFGGSVTEAGEQGWSAIAETREVYIGWEDRYTQDMKYTYSGWEDGTGSGCSGGGWRVDHPNVTNNLDAQDIYDVCLGKFESPFLEFRGENENSTDMDLTCRRSEGDDTWTLDGSVHVSP